MLLLCGGRTPDFSVKDKDNIYIKIKKIEIGTKVEYTRNLCKHIFVLIKYGLSIFGSFNKVGAYLLCLVLIAIKY